MRNLRDAVLRSSRGEGLWFILLRLALAILVFLTFLACGVYTVVLLPQFYDATTDTGTKMYYATDSVAFGQVKPVVLVTGLGTQDAVNVTALPSAYDAAHGGKPSQCTVDATDGSGYESTRYICDSEILTTLGADILVTFNWTRFDELFAQRSQYVQDNYRLMFVDVSVGDEATSTYDILHYNRHIYLDRNSRVQTFLKVDYREKVPAADFVNWDRLRKFGLATMQRYHLIDFVDTLPETDPGLFQSGAGLATLRLRAPGSSWQNKMIIRDSVDYPIFLGLATAGGFWVFFNGLFTGVFGAGVFYYILGRHPSSTSGVVHLVLGKIMKLGSRDRGDQTPSPSDEKKERDEAFLRANYGTLGKDDRRWSEGSNAASSNA